MKTTPSALAGEETTAEKRTRKNLRKEENANSTSRPRRSKRDAIETSVAVEDEDQNKDKETPPHAVEMRETQQLQDQVWNSLDNRN